MRARASSCSFLPKSYITKVFEDFGLERPKPVSATGTSASTDLGSASPTTGAPRMNFTSTAT
eukprot:12004438-Alexandrium_andersonii.AAC.1